MDEDTLMPSLGSEEESWWKEAIKDFRGRMVSSPKHYTSEILNTRGTTKEQLEANIDTLLHEVREQVWQLYLLDEAKFHAGVLAHLVENRNVPKEMLTKLIDVRLLEADFAELSRDELVKRIAGIIGEYTALVMPYIYLLSLSTTQSRRSRAGKTFEGIIEAFMDVYGHPYQNQSSLGKTFFTQNNLGKKVDLIVPGAEAYARNRAMCAVVTAKTSLRERWQEVAEELQRTNVPHIFLLTADDKVTNNTVSIMNNYNITLVVYSSEKILKFQDNDKVIDYKTFFGKEMAHIVSYWK